MNDGCTTCRLTRNSQLFSMFGGSSLNKPVRHAVCDVARQMMSPMSITGVIGSFSNSPIATPLCMMKLGKSLIFEMSPCCPGTGMGIVVSLKTFMGNLREYGRDIRTNKLSFLRANSKCLEA